MIPELSACPFCAAGQTQWRESKNWTGMRNVIISVSIYHWCPREDGQPQSIIQIAGRDHASAAARWNSRK